MAKALTSLDNVKLLLQEEKDTKNDVLEYLIKAASQQIREHTRRRFTIANPLPPETRMFLVYRDRTVYLDEVSSINSIVDKNSLAIEYETIPESNFPAKGEYMVVAEPVNYSNLPPMHADLFTINLNGPYPADYRSWPMRVYVNGTWGYTKVPDVVEYQCARTVAQWYKGGVAEFTQTYALGGGGTELFPVPDALPTAVVRALKPWVKPGRN